jgi:hypothetical protein
MTKDQDALNYPYIRIRNVEWLKRTLLVFPHVVRIAPTHDAPEDSKEVAEFRDLIGRRGPLLRNVDLDNVDLWRDQSELKARIAEAISADKQGFIGQFGREATRANRTLMIESLSLWDDRLASRTFQLHSDKVASELLSYLFEMSLAWNPDIPHGRGYVEMHPRLGEAVLATLALACAKREGLSLVTEFPDIYGRTIHRSKEQIFRSSLGLASEAEDEKPEEPRPADLVEFLVYQNCDVSKLTPENLLALNRDWEPIGAFREELEKIAADIPSEIENSKILEQYLRERANKLIAQWKNDHKNMLKQLKDLLTGDGEEAQKALSKLMEKVLGAEPVGGAITGGLGSIFSSGPTLHALLGAGAGLAIGVVFRTANNAMSLRKKRSEDPLRYLTMMEKAGVSYVTST